MSSTPSHIQLHKKSKTLELQFGDLSYNLSAEFLRVHSPSAEVRGHGSESAVLQYGKAQVAINTLEPAGNYGLRIFFDDNHNSGIYTWHLLYELATTHDQLMSTYLKQLQKADKARQPGAQILRITP
jgi:DUF971 family protein